MNKLVPALLIVGLLGGQVAVSAYSAALKWQTGREVYHRTWPFLDYPMYSNAEGPPVTTNVPQLFAELPDGRRVAVTYEAMGLEYFGWRFTVLERLVAKPVSKEQSELAALVEAHRDEARELAAAAVQRMTGQRPVRFIVERRVYLLEGHELKESDQVQIADMPPAPLIPPAPQEQP